MAIIFDVAVIVIFVLIGRSTHDHGVKATGVVSTTWPFLVGLVGGWVYAIKRHLPVMSIRGGVAIVVVTVAVGMLLRVIAGQGTAFAFIVVALAFLGAMMLGWRLLWPLIVKRRR